MTLRDAWDEQADAWARFARTPGHDRAHSLLNFPAFLELLPPPERATHISVMTIGRFLLRA